MPPSMMSSWFCDKSAIEFAEVSRSELSILMPKALKVALRARPRGDARCDRAHGAEPHRGFLCTGTAHRSQNDRCCGSRRNPVLPSHHVTALSIAAGAE